MHGMLSWEEALKAEKQEDLKEMKLFLFRENIRLENERREIVEMQDKLIKERVSFRNEMDTLNHKMVMERKRLKDDTLFFDKKMDILKEGFKQLEADRQKIEREKEELRLQQHEFNRSETGDELFFRGANNPLAVRKRYRDLLKIFHPDNLGGDDKIVQLINEEYEKYEI